MNGAGFEVARSSERFATVQAAEEAIRVARLDFEDARTGELVYAPAIVDTEIVARLIMDETTTPTVEITKTPQRHWPASGR